MYILFAGMKKKNEIDIIPDYVAYTDGSCNNFSPYGEGGAAFIILQGDRQVCHRAKGFLGTTNNRMEMLAIISAVNSIPEGSSILVRTDSKIAINAFENQPVKAANHDLIDLYAKVSDGKRVFFEWVKGHSGNEWNEFCDEIANNMMQEIRIKNSIPLYDYRNSPKCKK